MFPAMVRYEWCKVLCGENYELYNPDRCSDATSFFFFCMCCTHMLKQRNIIILIYLEFFLVRENSVCAQGSVSVVHLVTFQVKL